MAKHQVTHTRPYQRRTQRSSRIHKRWPCRPRRKPRSDRKHTNRSEVCSHALEIIEVRRVHHVTSEGSGCHHGSINEMRARQAQRGERSTSYLGELSGERLNDHGVGKPAEPTARAAGMPFSPCRRRDRHAQAMRPGSLENGSSTHSPTLDGNESSRIERNQVGSRSSSNTRRTSASGKSTPSKCSAMNLRSRSRRASSSISRSTYALTEPDRRAMALARLSARLESERLSLCWVIPRVYYASARAATR
jgi:hypothetical protein